MEQSKSDLSILHKYYSHLQSCNNQINQLISFKSQENYEYLYSQAASNQSTYFQNQLKLEMKKDSNHMHHWHVLMMSSPDQFNNISKLLLIKKKLVSKTNELMDLRKIFFEKEALYRYLNEIYMKRQKLLQKKNAYNALKSQLINQK